MEQQSASAHALRIGKNEQGFSKDREKQANRSQASRRAFKPASHARGQTEPLEKDISRKMDSAVIHWEIRCAEMDQATWREYTGPAEVFRMMRIFAEAIDADNARPIAFGKPVSAEVRRIHYARSPDGRHIRKAGKIMRFDLSGEYYFRYHANLISTKG